MLNRSPYDSVDSILETYITKHALTAGVPVTHLLNGVFICSANSSHLVTLDQRNLDQRATNVTRRTKYLVIVSSSVVRNNCTLQDLTDHPSLGGRRVGF